MLLEGRAEEPEADSDDSPIMLALFGALAPKFISLRFFTGYSSLLAGVYVFITSKVRRSHGVACA